MHNNNEQKHIQYEFVKLLKENIKTNITEKENNMNIEFEDDIEDTLFDGNNPSRDSKPTPSYNPMGSNNHDINTQPKNIYTEPKASQIYNKEEVKTNHNQSNISFADFEKLKEDIMLKIEHNNKLLETRIDEKLEKFNKGISSLEDILENLNKTSKTLFEVNTLIEEMNNKTQENIVHSKDSIIKEISKLSDFVKDEANSANELVDKYMKNKSSTSVSLSHNEENKNRDTSNTDDEYSNYELENNRYESENEFTNEDEFVKGENYKNKKENLGFMGKLFKKIGL
ncbi:hypothetical protein [Aliarcobacter butzleri]|uniref:hypothetical protein n=1 Tax=Aliarcobacter butzleri TaxID=28197 RepID=UPI001269F5A4|nr:hypothetical protein [Aliarcobacter butzleri]